MNTSEDEFYRSSQMPETRYFEQYGELSAPKKAVVVYPILTQSAYSWGGIHDFYNGYCDTCTTTSIEDAYEPIFSSSAKSFRILEFLGYDVIDDIDIDKNPNILKKYDTVVLLHNEFATEKEFAAINSHKNVIYLYPGVFMSKVQIDYDKYSINLLRGPSYPTSDIKRGFDWKYDNSDLVENTSCENWNFYNIENGHMLNCTPEYLIQNDAELLKKIRELGTKF